MNGAVMFNCLIGGLVFAYQNKVYEQVDGNP